MSQQAPLLLELWLYRLNRILYQCLILRGGLTTVLLLK